MMNFTACLFYMALLFWMQKKSGFSSVWPLVFWMLPAGWLFSNLAENRLFDALLLFCLASAAFYQDLQTCHFSKGWLWILAAVLVFALRQPVDLLSRLLAMSFGGAALFLWRRQAMGSADVFCLMAFGFLLGLERMLVCLLVSCLAALVFRQASRQRLIPFISFLSWGFLISWFRGYTLYGQIGRLLEAF